MRSVKIRETIDCCRRMVVPCLAFTDGKQLSNRGVQGHLATVAQRGVSFATRLLELRQCWGPV